MASGTVIKSFRDVNGNNFVLQALHSTAITCTEEVFDLCGPIERQVIENSKIDR